MNLAHGILLHDTIGRVLGMIVPLLADDTIVAIDSKTSRRTGNKTKAQTRPLHWVSAFAAGMGVVLGQTATAEKSNEITAIPELLSRLVLEGCVVTIDAMGTQTQIARTIRERGAHDVLCVKKTPPNLYDSILLADHDSRAPLSPSSTHETTIKSHGRTEVRRCRAYAATERLYQAQDWQGLTSFAIIERLRTQWASTPASNGPVTSAACPPMPSVSLVPCVLTGRGRIVFTGVWMCSSTRISHEYAAVMPPTTWPSSATS